MAENAPEWNERDTSRINHEAPTLINKEKSRARRKKRGKKTLPITWRRTLVGENFSQRERRLVKGEGERAQRLRGNVRRSPAGSRDEALGQRGASKFGIKIVNQVGVEGRE